MSLASRFHTYNCIQLVTSTQIYYESMGTVGSTCTQLTKSFIYSVDKSNNVSSIIDFSLPGHFHAPDAADTRSNMILLVSVHD